MKLGVFTVLLSQMKLQDALKYLKSLGVEAVELGCGGYPGNSHVDSEALLADESKITELKNLVASHDMVISALSCHGNPVHPNKAIAAQFDKDFQNAVLLASKLGVDTIVTFSGCPGDSEGASYPNWVTCAWPEDFGEILKYQWEEVLIPYWKKTVAFAKSHGIHKIALEMHPGFCVYNPSTLMRLREAVGKEIGANFDPSHLIWQGIDPAAAIKAIGDGIFHFHAKDTKVDPLNTAVNGVLDTTDYKEFAKRAWLFRTVGYGSSPVVWKDIMSALSIVGYDGAISIEHEDGLMSIEEGLTKAINFLQHVIIKEKADAPWWA
ncbi:MAG: sugar phosphate isomerase/epimerase [Clostridia bacterium]